MADRERLATRTLEATVGLFDRFRRPGAKGAALLERARRRSEEAEYASDSSPKTRAKLAAMYAEAAEALAGAGHPDQVEAWLALAEIRHYQKGRRAEAQAAFERAITVAPELPAVWDAYVDFALFGISYTGLVALTERIPTPLRPGRLWRLLSVADGTDVWGRLPSGDGARYRAELPALLSRLGDQVTLGAYLSEAGVIEEKAGL